MRSDLAFSLGVPLIVVSVLVAACGSDAVGDDLTTPGGAPSGGASSGTPGGVGGSDAGPGSSTTAIRCGTITCSLPAESCCVSEVQNGGGSAYACVAGSACPRSGGGGAALACSGAANCASGTVCCISGSKDSAASSTCKTSCTSNEAQLCDPKAGAAECPAGRACSSKEIGDWGLPSSYGTCGGKGR